jgi:anti-sigma regulatory factor (Ser/Thr protein kinase)
METPEGNPRGSGHILRHRPGPGVAGGSSRATVLGSLTIPGRPEQVCVARAFIAQTLGTYRVGADNDTATLLTSEIVTNAIAHTKSGVEGGTVTIVVIDVPCGVLVEVIDEGSTGIPIVKGDLYAAQGHGLFLVQELATQWGYLRNQAGTTVWFHLVTADDPQQIPEQAGPEVSRQAGPPPGRRDQDRSWPAHLWAATNSAPASA